MRLCWLTDIHLNFLTGSETDHFLSAVRATEADAILLTGDIGEARSVAPLLTRLDEAWQRPFYFVLGNHDFYGGSIAGVRKEVTALARSRPRLVYLTAAGVVHLTDHVGLVGDDGWADARLGNYVQSLVMMNDYRLIAELAPLTKEFRWPKLKELGDQAAEHIRRVLPPALAKYREVILATHLPPLRDACWHEGQISDDEWLPHFTCKALGDAILEIMRATPQRKLTVYCGHTHSSGICTPLPNVTIHTGSAQYGLPSVQQVIEME
ncbi:MAG TPA: metallophosphoesterase [Pirellulales bacterium]|jgi:predicted MPP superfamily phosphohydrolase|nr:metallophosphoesterase [Pirellulales bacterium]